MEQIQKKKNAKKAAPKLTLVPSVPESPMQESTQMMPERLPEVQGDLVDQAQDEIDAVIREKIEQIRRRAHP